MESDEIRAALRAADRAEAASWTDYPPTPQWYPPATGAWAAALTLALGGLDGGARTSAVVALLAVELAFLAWYVRYRGDILPTGTAPHELRPAIVRFAAAVAAVVAGVGVLTLTVDVLAGATLAFVGVTAVVTWYEHAYGAAIRRVRERLA
jgi:hypothetical protein